MSNFQRLFRFPWKRQRIANYLLHVDEDLRALFPSVALELIIGPKATYSPYWCHGRHCKPSGPRQLGRHF